MGEDVDRKVVDKFDFGNDDYSLGWWFMGRQVGVAMRESPLLRSRTSHGSERT